MSESAAIHGELPTESDVSALLERLAREYLVPGAQFAVRHRGEVRTFLHGVAARSSGEPVTADTLFPLGSTTKLVTATLLMQLVSDGDIELDAPIGPLLPELAEAPGPLRESTVRQLLSHTAGLPDMPATEHDPSLRACVAAGAGVELLSEPGRVFSYSNLGYTVAGRLLEAVTGLSWWDAARSFVLQPLGVPSGFLGAAPDAPGGLAGPAPQTAQHAVHLPTSSVHPVEEPGLPKALVPAGALVTSAAGLLRLSGPHHGADGPDVLEPELLEEMRRPVTDAPLHGLAEGWGLGLAVHTDGAGRRWYGHDGNTGGATCALRFHPESGTAVALMTNATSGRQMGNQLFEELAALGWEIGRVPAPAGEEPLAGAALRAAADEVCGAYSSGAETVKVRAEADGRLVLDRPQLPPARLELHPGLTFRLRTEPEGARGDARHGSDESRDLYSFVRDSRTGRVGGMYLSGGRLQVREGTGRLG